MSALALRAAAALEAHEPPEARGLRRDEVRLLVAERATGAARRTRASATCRRSSTPGDLLVVNTSATLAGRARRAARRHAVELHLSTPLPGDRPLGRRAARGDGAPFRAAAAGERARRCPAAARATLARALRSARRGCGSPSSTLAGAAARLPRAGTAARSATATSASEWPLDGLPDRLRAEPGSAEMPSAGRPFTAELITGACRARHRRRADRCCTPASRRSSSGERPYPERFRVPAATARLVNATPRRGRSRDRRRHDRRARARDRRRAGTARSRPPRAGRASSSRPRRGRPRGRRPADRLARTRARRTCGCSRPSPAASCSSAPTPRRSARLPLARVRRRAPDPPLTPADSATSHL